MNQPHSLYRREFMRRGFAATAGTILGAKIVRVSEDDLIKSISQEISWDNLDGKSQTWFHPRCCMVPDDNNGFRALLTLQTISGSDYFGPVHFSVSNDLGKNWSEPEPIPALGRKLVEGHDGLQKGVCDVVPQYHPATETTLAMGHVVFYRGQRFSAADQLQRYPVYCVRQSDGSWSNANRLKWDDPRGAFIYSNNCGQRVNMPNGDILLAFTFGPKSEHRSVAGVRCGFDGEKLEVLEVGPPLTSTHKRGLLEPSLVALGGEYFLTIRAEDNRGYVSRSQDGLNWTARKPWAWDNGEALTMSTTQQHWLAHSDGLFLVYTRKDSMNTNVIRWRSPLFMAQVDLDNLCLIRESERVVVPMSGDGVNEPDQVPLMGNFHINFASPDESWVTVGSWLPRAAARGAVHLARIEWTTKNRRSPFD